MAFTSILFTRVSRKHSLTLVPSRVVTRSSTDTPLWFLLLRSTFSRTSSLVRVREESGYDPTPQVSPGYVFVVLRQDPTHDWSVPDKPYTDKIPLFGKQRYRPTRTVENNSTLNSCILHTV